MIPLGLALSSWLGSLSASFERSVPSAYSTEAFAWTFVAVTVAMVSLASVMGPGCCHEEGTTSGHE